MTGPNIHRRLTVFSDRNLLETAGSALLEIKQQDALTWTDVGKSLGVCDDTAGKYANGMSEMGFTTFMRGKREWGGRFAGPVERLVINSRPGTVSGHMAVGHMLSAVGAIHAGMKDGEISPRDIHENRSTLEVARDQLDDLLRLTAVRAA